jgi:hypothetical protein
MDRKGGNMNKRSKKFAFKLLSTQLLMTALMMTSINAQAQRRGGGHHGPVGPHVNNGIERKAAPIKQYMYQGDIIPVLRTLQLKQEMMQGKELVGLAVKAQSTGYNSKLVLLVNNQKVDAVQLSQYSQRVQFQIPQYMQINKMQIKVKGGAYIDRIVAKLQLPILNNKPIKARVNQYVQGTTILPVRRLIKEQNPGIQLQGQVLKKVILKAQPTIGGGYGRRGRLAKATLLINGMPVGMTKTLGVDGNQNGKIVFNLQGYYNVIGQDIKKIQIEIQGAAQVQMVGLKLQQQNGPYGPGSGHGRVRGRH